MSARSIARPLLILTALLTVAGCASSGDGSASADLPPVVPCEPQPWDVTGAPYTEDEYRVAGALPPMVTNSEQVQRMVLDGTRRMRQMVSGSSVRLQTVFQLLVGPDGEVLDRQMAVSSGTPAMDQLAAAMADAIEFRPGTRFGCGVATWFEFPFRIAIN